MGENRLGENPVTDCQPGLKVGEKDKSSLSDKKKESNILGARSCFWLSLSLGDDVITPRWPAEIYMPGWVDISAEAASLRSLAATVTRFL